MSKEISFTQAEQTLDELDMQWLVELCIPPLKIKDNEFVETQAAVDNS